MKTQQIVLIAGAGIAVWYMIHEQRKNAVTPQIPGPTAAPVVTPTNETGGSTANVPAMSPTAAKAAQSTNPIATVAQEQTIFNWAHGLTGASSAAFFLHWPDMTSGDIANLMDWIVVLWPSGKPPSAAQTNAWNAWRVKYGILV